MAKSYFKQEHDLGKYCVKFRRSYFGSEKYTNDFLIDFFCTQRREERRLLGLGKNTQTGSR